jgi:hypothetical protein
VKLLLYTIIYGQISNQSREKEVVTLNPGSNKILPRSGNEIVQML